VIDGKNYYRISEACKMAGTNRMTFLRWVRENKFEDVPYRDLNGWRLFSEQDIGKLRAKINRLQPVDAFLETQHLR
jgi:hypothetical protein